MHKKEKKSVTFFNKLKIKNKPFIKKYFTIFLFLILFILLIINIMYLVGYLSGEFYKKFFTCVDGTIHESCSLRKPYICLGSILVEKASLCGCPDFLTINGDSCMSEYQTNPKEITLKYVLRGEKQEVNFTVYGGLIDYISKLPKFIDYSNGEKPTRQDFKLRNIYEKEQKKLLLPLITKIQNLAKTREDQVRIAVSIIQNIPYEISNKTFNLGNQQVNYSRYPYEVLYENKGVCEDKSELLAFLLKEMGYGVVLFYYPVENHEAVGIKCPIEYSLNNSGYCFIETTGPSIISNNKNYYTEIVKLFSEPEIILISDGNSFGEDLYEYKDAIRLNKIDSMIEEKGKLNIFYYLRLNHFKKKYDFGFLYRG